MNQNKHPTAPAQNYQYIFTVFTPTYNRAHTLPRVYESLKVQTYWDFEWLIVDDGSTDDTNRLVEQWQKEAEFPIRYIYQENSGKHIAFNRGVRGANGELFLTLDSDDACVPEALARFRYHWDTILLNQKESFSAVTCLCIDESGEVIGSHFPFEPTDSDSLEIRYRFKVTGEKWGFHRTNVLRQFPFPEIPGYKFIPEGIVWSRIARKYKTRFVNEPLRIYFKGVDQLTKSSSAETCALVHALWHKEILNTELDYFGFAPISFLHSSVHYSRFSFHSKSNICNQIRSLDLAFGKVLWLIALPIGYIVYLRDRYLDV